jgi:putative transposase
VIRVVTFTCSLLRDEADSLNHESGRIYTNALVWHYRSYRRKGIWLSENAIKRLEDSLGGNTTLHAHSRDAAQEGFFEACKVTRIQRGSGLDIRYPHRRKWYRTTVWKSTGIRVSNGCLLLARSRKLAPITVRLPSSLRPLSPVAFRQAKLVWDAAAQHYFWHVTIEDGQAATIASGQNVAAVDLGEVHPAALTDGKVATVICTRRLRAVYQYTSKRLAEIRGQQDHKMKGSRRWTRLQRRKNRFLAQQKRRARDIEHKVSRAVVDWAEEQKVATLAIGDVRDIANGKRLNAKSQQKIGTWSHGRQRAYITYKAKAVGIAVVLVNEGNTSKTCPKCQHEHKPKGRVYHCSRSECGFVGHRDVVGSINILSKYRFGAVGRLLPPAEVTYRYPSWTGKRSPLDTGQVAR